MTRDVVTGAWREVSPEWRERESGEEQSRGQSQSTSGPQSPQSEDSSKSIERGIRCQYYPHSEEACCQIYSFDVAFYTEHTHITSLQTYIRVPEKLPQTIRIRAGNLEGNK